jgi:hypothetical protein
MYRATIGLGPSNVRAHAQHQSSMNHRSSSPPLPPSLLCIAAATLPASTSTTVIYVTEKKKNTSSREASCTHTRIDGQERNQLTKTGKKKELRTRKSLMRLVRYVRLARLTSPSSSDPPRKKTMCFFALKHRLPLSKKKITPYLFLACVVGQD